MASTSLFVSSYSFVVTNGESSRNGTLHFSIEHGDRIPATLSRNAGLRLLEGAMETLTPEHLELTDPDTPPTNLTFTLTQVFKDPQRGY